MTARVLVLDIESRSVPTDDGCRVWQRATSKGYGVLRRDGHNLLAHRITCEDANGPAPEGKPHALHRCNNKLCVLGAHLYWGDNADNARDRKAAGTARGGRYRATHCIHGHEFNEENTYHVPLGRHCRECGRRRVRERRARLKASTA